MNEDHLIGWLCFIRLQFDNDHAVDLPTIVGEELVRRGWLTKPKPKDWDGLSPINFTDKGLQVSDLAAPEWGINPIPCGAE